MSFHHSASLQCFTIPNSPWLKSVLTNCLKFETYIVNKLIPRGLSTCYPILVASLSWIYKALWTVALTSSIAGHEKVKTSEDLSLEVGAF
jgi:hypothetical protein